VTVLLWLGETVHYLWGLDADYVIECRDNVIDVVELRARRLVGLDLFRPGDDERIAGATEVGGHQLRIAEWRIPGPGPTGMVHVVGLGSAKRIQSAKFVQRRNVLRNLGRNAFRERFGTGPIEYLRMLRLNAARADLKTAQNQGLRVRDVARRLGYHHLGNFAADYRRHFDVLPSRARLNSTGS
jgi:AraC-like DNA-binding protein